MAAAEMGFWGEGWAAIRLVVLLAYGAQVGQLLLLPVPSSFSTVALLARSGPQAANHGQSGLSFFRRRLLALAAALALAGALIPLAVCMAPGIYSAILPLFVPGPGWRLAGCLLLFSGNLLTLAAVLTLRQKAAFDPGGETEILVTSGIFRWVRHPVLAGLALLYLGFLLLLPSAVLLAGLCFFVVNARYRMGLEEEELARRFGAEYVGYAARTGRLAPRFMG